MNAVNEVRTRAGEGIWDGRVDRSDSMIGEELFKQALLRQGGPQLVPHIPGRGGQHHRMKLSQAQKEVEQLEHPKTPQLLLFLSPISRMLPRSLCSGCQSLKGHGRIALVLGEWALSLKRATGVQKWVHVNTTTLHVSFPALHSVFHRSEKSCVRAW